MKVPMACGFAGNPEEGEKKRIDSELWHACAGPLVSLPPVGSLVVYFPQGHSEQVAASMQKEIDGIPNYPSLPSKLICVLLDVTMHADAETDEVYAQMTLQPVNKYDREAMLASETGLKQNKHPAEFFCKTLTASDTSTHGGFSVPRRAAEKIFPPLDFTMQPPAQELVVKDLHDVSWTFRHVFRGQPKRHLLTTGWSVFVGTKRLSAGDSVLFIRDAELQLLFGVRRANRQQPALSSSVLSSDSMHIGILAAAAHAATNNSPFTIFYNPRASPSEFVIPFAKYNKAMYTQVSLGMRFRMMFETEDSSVRRYMGTVTGISDLDPVRWMNSQWHNLQVGWDESTATERRTRVSIWEIEPLATPFYLCPPPFFKRNFPEAPGVPDAHEVENAFQRVMPWLNDDYVLKDTQSALFPGLSLVQWMSMQQNHQLMAPAAQPAHFPSAIASPLPNGLVTEDPTKMLNFQTHGASAPSLNSKLNPQTQQLNQTLQLPRELQQQPQLLPQTSASHHVQLPPLQQKSINLWQQQFQQQGQLQQPQSQPQPQPHRPVAIQEAADHQFMQHQTSSGQIVSQTHSSSQHLQPSLLQLQELQSSCFSSMGLLHQSLLPQILPVQQPLECQHSLLQKQQEQLQRLMQPQLQLQLLQKLQQQQLLSQLSPSLLSQLPQLLAQQNQQYQERQDLQQRVDGSSNLPLQLKELHQEHEISALDNQKSLLVRTQSSLSGTMGPSLSNFPSTNSHIVSLSLNSKTQQGPAILVEETVAPPVDNVLQELQSKPQVMIKHEQFSFNESKLPNQLPVADQLDASSTTSFCLDSKVHEGLSLPPHCLDGNSQDHQDNFLVGKMPDTLLSRGLGMGKEIQNLISGYWQQKDIDTELSTADISSQSFGVADMSFKPGCSTDVVANEGVPNRGAWANQPQRMRTYTKVQKRGSVGRCIDVTRYKGYDALRHDLACMFGIEGQLEDSHRTEWKLVYVDHENDILLVGDDPWEEFVSCVQSIKILSAAEVQQMSLDGNLISLSVRTEACSGSNSGNPWRGQLDDCSFASFQH